MHSRQGPDVCKIELGQGLQRELKLGAQALLVISLVSCELVFVMGS